jgi:polyhydroxyalkanoate synthase
MHQKTPVHDSIKAPVILVHGWGQNRYSWSLSSRSMEHYLVANGYETFNIELRGHGLSREAGSDHPENFRTYYKYDIPAFLEAVHEITNGRKMFYIGHSLGGTLSYVSGPLYQEYIAGIISIAGPIHFMKGNPLMKAFAKAGVFFNNFIPFAKIHPKPFYIDQAGKLARQFIDVLDSPLFVSPVQLWYPESMERDLLLERIDKGFDRTSFQVTWDLLEWTASGEFISKDNVNYEERMKDMQMPIFFVVGDKDTMVQGTDIEEACQRAGSADKTWKVFGGEEPGLHWGHLDLIHGKRAPDIIWPAVRSWMDDRLP